LTVLASCDFVYGVRRSTPVDSTFDRAQLEEWRVNSWATRSTTIMPGMASNSAHSFERGLGKAYVEFVPGELSVLSFRIGAASDDELQAWLRLQSELISALRERFPFLPPEASWHVINSYLEAQLAAGAGEPR
jgi:hypothetical protein